MTKLEYAKEHAHYATISSIKNFLDSINVSYDSKWKKETYTNLVLTKLNEDNVDCFLDVTELSMTRNETENILGLSNYYLKQLVKTNRIHIIGTYKNIGYGYGNLYKAYDVFNCIGLIKPIKRTKKSAKDILSDMPKIIEYYPNARKIHRKFYIHVGGTNTGKTYSSLLALKQCQNGVYLGPLRLLAIEVCDQLNSENYPCSLLTGEEECIVEDAFFESRTVEKVDINNHYEIAIIDECQMIEDIDRGASWTKAIMGLCADEIHAIVAPEGLNILIQMLNICGDDYEIIEHQRKVPLVVEENAFNHIKDNDALIVFSRKAVLSLAAELEREGIPVSIIYGSLPYSVRIKEAEKFRDGITKVVVSTDAIGMGLNLPIKRVIFMEGQKFDGYVKRPLKISEVKQIAGRAGRYGIFDIGYVGFFPGAITHKTLLNDIEKNTPSIRHAIMPFPEELLKKSNTYGKLLSLWSNYAEIPAPFEKKDVSREMKLYSQIASYHFTNDIAYKLCNIPFDDANNDLEQLWLMLIDAMYKKTDIMTVYPNCQFLEDESLETLETLYKSVDLFYSFAKTMGYDIALQDIQVDRENISFQIMNLLKEKKTKFIKKCCRCGKELTWNTPYKYCHACYLSLTNYDF